MNRAFVRPLPRHLLTDPAIEQALRRRDFGVVFAAAKQHGFSFNELSDATGIKAERISQGTRQAYTNPRIETVERIADGLHIPGEMLGLAPRPWEATTRSAPATGREAAPVDRRQFLHRTVATGTAGLLAGVLADTEDALAYDGGVDLTSLHTTIEDIGRGYEGRAPEDVLRTLVDELAAAGPLLKLHHPHGERIELARAVGQLGGMTAIVLHDLGRARDALACFTTAQKAARTAGDRRLRAWLLARRAMVPLNFGAPHVAAGIAEQARQAAGKSDTAAAALAAAVAARAHALAHADDDARDALAEADRIVARLPADERADTWLGYPLQKHWVHRSQALTHLRDVHGARESQAAGLEISRETGMTRTLLLLDAAMCVRHDGDAAGACQAAADALTGRPGSYRKGLVRQRAAELLHSVPASARGTAEARRLADVLADTD